MAKKEKEVVIKINWKKFGSILIGFSIGFVIIMTLWYKYKDIITLTLIAL